MWSLVCELVIPSLIFLHLQHGDNNTYLTALFGGINDNVQKILGTEAGIIVAVSIIVGYRHPHGYFVIGKVTTAQRPTLGLLGS